MLKTFKDNSLNIFSAFSIALWIANAIYLAAFLPIQTDEMSWSITNHRAIIDNYQTISLYPQCSKLVFAQKLPAIWIIPAWINHIIYSKVNTAFGLRLISIFKLLAWVLIWIALFKKILKCSLRQLLPSMAFILAAFSLDAEIILLIMARPEQSLLLGISLVLYLAIAATELKTKKTYRILATLLLIITVAEVGYSHAKAGAFLPLFVFTSYLFAEKRSEEHTSELQSR